MERMWVNQPSTLQPDHELHGTNVLMDDSTDKDYPDVYFLSGPVVAQKMAKLSLSKGWKPVVPN